LILQVGILLEIFIKTGKRMKTVHQLFWRASRYVPEIQTAAFAFAPATLKQLA
jgi:hypothetical protein